MPLEEEHTPACENCDRGFPLGTKNIHSTLLWSILYWRQWQRMNMIFTASPVIHLEHQFSVLKTGAHGPDHLVDFGLANIEVDVSLVCM